MSSRDGGGARILIVEDEALVSLAVEAVVVDLGYVPVGPAGSVAEAVALARGERLAAAILDVNLQGESAYPVADALAARGIPFAWMSGYRTCELPPPHNHAPTLEKPFEERMLMDAIRSLTGVSAIPAIR